MTMMLSVKSLRLHYPRYIVRFTANMTVISIIYHQYRGALYVGFS